jgi:hypothetical protein
MNYESDETRVYHVGKLFYEFCRSNEYKVDKANHLMEMVDLMFDDYMTDNLVPFWDALRDNAQIDAEFCKMLLESGPVDEDGIEDEDYCPDYIIVNVDDYDFDDEIEDDE